ncbi:MAG: signal peptidase II [Acidobacteriota bacterium]|nr:MAG: signal peptidase II [Acidobacteriota bacterium]
MNPRVRDLILAAGWLVADQATKLWANSQLASPLTIIPGLFQLSLSYNTGAMFGLLATWPDPWRSVLLTGIPLIAVVAVTALLWRVPLTDVYARVGLALILGGAVGNLIDRIFRGYVVDFLDVFCSYEPIAGFLLRVFGSYRWPTFNLADTGLTCGAVLLALELFRRQPANGAAKAE